MSAKESSSSIKTATVVDSNTTVTVSHRANPEIVAKEVDTVETPARYLAYFARMRPILLASSRYVAYTSDVGEAFRPVVSPGIVRAGYGISFAYLGFDIAFEGYKAHKAGASSDVVGMTVMKRGIFQGLASMALPAFTIHSAVHYAGKAFKDSANATLKRWGPSAVGLAIVPVLPYLFDHPVEYAVDKVFEVLEGGHGKTLAMSPAGKEQELETAVAARAVAATVNTTATGAKKEKTE